MRRLILTLVILAGCSSRLSRVIDQEPPPAAPAGLDGLIYSATAGVNRAAFVPVTNNGAQTQRRISPSRGGGFGLGEGSLRHRATTLDGERLIVSFETRERQQVLFALSTDGSTAEAPVRIATASWLRSDIEVSPDSEHLLFVDGDDLFRARLDGVGAPTRLASAPADMEITRPRWAQMVDRVVFELERNGCCGSVVSTIHSARIDGSEADAPLALTTPNGQQRAQVVLPDGRVIVSLSDRPLWAIPVTGGTPVRLTPTTQWVSLTGVIDNGAHLVVELRDSSTWPHQLAVVATDGSTADQPIYLSDSVNDLRALLSPDGSRVAYVAKDNAANRWAIFDVATDVPYVTGTGRITDWLSWRPFLWSWTSGAGSIVACDQTGAVLRVDRPGSPSAAPVVLATAATYQPGGCPAVGLAADQVLYRNYDGSGWGTRGVPLAGGNSYAVVDGPNVGAFLPGGVVFFEYDYTLAALFVLSDGVTTRVTPWYESAISEAHMVEQRVVFAAEGVWHITDLSDNDPLQLTDTIGRFVGIVEDRLLLWDDQSDNLLHSVPLDGSAPTTLLDVPQTPFLLVPERGRVIFAESGSLYSVRVDGSDVATPTVVIRDAANVWQLNFDPTSNRVLVAHAWANDLLAANIDGSEADSPVLLAQLTGLDYLVWGVSIVPNNERVLVTLATNYTAVPHPYSVITVRESGLNAQQEPQLAPPGYTLVNSSEDWDWEQPSLSSLTSDGEWAVMRGPDGLYGARTDGSDAAAPPLALASTYAQLIPGLPLALDDRHWVALDSGRLFAFTVDGSSPSVVLTPDVGIASRAFWTEGDQLIFGTGGRLYVTRTDGSDSESLRPLTPEEVIVGEVELVGDTAIFQRQNGPDRSLMRVGLDSPPDAVTPIDDAAETLVGFVQ